MITVHIYLKLFDFDIVALLDSGAKNAVTGGKAIGILKYLGLNITPSALKQVLTADGTQ